MLESEKLQAPGPGKRVSSSALRLVDVASRRCRRVRHRDHQAADHYGGECGGECACSEDRNEPAST